MSVPDSGVGDSSAAGPSRGESVSTRAVSADGALRVAGVVPVDRSEPLPMSFAQQRLWFLDRMSGVADDYLVWFSWRVRGEINRAAWQGALDDVLARHEVLRTELVEIDGLPVQRPRHGVSVPLDWHESGDEQQALIAAAEFTSRRFDLARAPLLRAAVWRLRPGGAVAAIVFHHAAIDGWSKQIFMAEFAACYRARLTGAEPALPVLPVQYGDYAVWQRNRMTAGLLEGQLDYWRAALAGVPELELPADRPRPSAWTGLGDAVELPLPPGLVTDLEKLARDAGATLFMVLLAAFQVVLGRWSGQDDVLVGTPVAGRGRLELEGLIGFFVNTLLLRGDLAGEPSFADYLGRVRDAVLGAFDHQDVPFEQIVAELRPQRDLSRNPLFQVMFDVQDRSPIRSDLPGLVLEPCALPWKSAKFDLTVTFVLRPGEFGVEAEYSTDLFDEPTVRRLARQLGRVLAAVVADPAVGIWDIGLLSPTERAELLALAGDTRPGDGQPGDGRPGDAWPPTAPLVLTGTGATLICGAETVSGDELDRLVDRLAGVLAARGVRRGSAVGVCLGRGVWSVLAMLAIWRAGGVYVPLDPAFPLRRLGFMVAEAGVRFVVGDDQTAEVVAGLDVTGVPVREVGPAREVGPTQDVAPVAGDLAYVIFTSGSSGRPKAVGVGHDALARQVAAAIERFRITAADTVLTFASFSFDAALEQVLPGLARGARLLIRPDELWTVAELAAQIRAHGVTVADLTPGYWAEVVAQLGAVAADLASLRLLVTGGEVLPPAPLRAWFDRLPGVPIMNTYGPTEATISATSFLVTEPIIGRVPIGRPLGTRRLYVVDGRDELVPLGVPGELLVGGPELARGYLGRPELTAAQFVPDPFGAGLVYRTGDRVRWLPDGNLDFLGRVDDQVQIRGYRVEPGEVRDVLGEFDGVRGAVVVVRDGILTGYVAGDSLELTALTAHCRHWLPEYMVPAIVPLDALPLTVQGKVDLAALARLPLPGAAGTDYAPPGSPAEVVLAEVWQTVLGVPEAGVHDDFFELGGTSLAAVRVAALAAARGVPVTVRDLVEHPTIAALAAAVDQGAATEVRSAVRLREGTGPALWCVHPTGGSATWYVPLARALPAGRPVRAFQARGLVGGVDPVTVPGIAANYVAELTAAAEPGPHRLLGWSMGANLALEMATQLHRAGQRAGPLVLIEPYLPSPTARRQLAGFGTAMTAALDLRDRARALPDGSPQRQALLAELCAALLAAGVTQSEADLAQDAPIEVWHSLLTALADYQPRPYPGHLHLVVGRAAAELPDDAPMPGQDISYRGYLARWQELALGGLTVHVIPGDHWTILTEPVVRELAVMLANAGI